MMTISNCVYANLKKRGLHNWGFLGGKQDFDFDFNDMDFEMMGKDGYGYLKELEE